MSGSTRVDTIRRLEEIGFVTWPAFERERFDGWELRETRGVTRRANSVNPIGPSHLSLDEKIGHAERWFVDRGRPPVFRLTELAEPGLDEALTRRGYARSDTTDTMVGPVAAVHMPDGVRLGHDVTDPWFGAFCAWNGRDPAQAADLRRLLEAIPGDRAYASVEKDDGIAAVGLGVVALGHVGIYNMNTDPSQRRRGLARTILSGLLAFGAEHGAETAFLQVLRDNAPAQALYTAAGFRRLYEYWYREPA